MVVAVAVGEAIENIILLAINQFAAPALGAVGADVAPLRDAVFVILPIVFGALGVPLA